MKDYLDNLIFKVKEFAANENLNRHYVGNSPNHIHHKTIGTEIHRKAEEITITHILESFPGEKIISESFGVLNESVKDPKYTFVIQCLSEIEHLNVHLPLYGMSVAVLEGNVIGCDGVSHAVLVDFSCDVQLSATKGQGTYINNIQLSPSTKKNSQLIACNCNDFDEHTLSFLNKLHTMGKYIRIFGSSIISLAYVVQGVCCAYYDTQGTAKPHEFLAASLLLSESGGILTDTHGQNINNILDYMPHHNFVASSHKATHNSFLSVFN